MCNNEVNDFRVIVGHFEWHNHCSGSAIELNRWKKMKKKLQSLYQERKFHWCNRYHHHHHHHLVDVLWLSTIWQFSLLNSFFSFFSSYTQTHEFSIFIQFYKKFSILIVVVFFLNLSSGTFTTIDCNEWLKFI